MAKSLRKQALLTIHQKGIPCRINVETQVRKEQDKAVRDVRLAARDLGHDVHVEVVRHWCGAALEITEKPEAVPTARQKRNAALKAAGYNSYDEFVVKVAASTPGPVFRVQHLCGSTVAAHRRIRKALAPKLVQIRTQPCRTVSKVTIL